MDAKAVLEYAKKNNAKSWICALSMFPVSGSTSATPFTN